MRLKRGRPPKAKTEPLFVTESPEAEVVTAPAGPKVRKLPQDTLFALTAQNETRRLNGLPELKVKVRTCLACSRRFESLGRATCGCTKGQYE